MHLICHCKTRNSKSETRSVRTLGSVNYLRRPSRYLSIADWYRKFRLRSTIRQALSGWWACSRGEPFRIAVSLRRIVRRVKGRAHTRSRAVIAVVVWLASAVSASRPAG